MWLQFADHGRALLPMSYTNLVRPSRDGDQFHYLWAARRCLKLLASENDLVAVSIEGPSPGEQPGGDPIEAGEELIDIAEYFGSEDIAQARLVRYMQLKHSTRHANESWTASGLAKTLKGFSKRYATLREAYAELALAEKLQFWFVTNRPISQDVVEAVVDAAAEATTRHPAELIKLQTMTGLVGSELAAFCKLLHFEDRQDGYWDQRNLLFQEVSGYLPDADVDAPMQLKELVTRRALSEGEHNPTITKIDVLRVLKTDESRLFPAPCLIEHVGDAVAREQEIDIVDQIIRASAPVIVHAPGGVGKSVFATRIGPLLPSGSVSILYDCFGNGQYRSVTGYRHRHKDALVQMANELAARGYCHPLIPTTSADAGAYARAFVYRLSQAARIVRASNPTALVCIVVDAADNAQMAATEIGEVRSFVRDLIRVGLPEGVRLVFLCRSHRQDLLDPPSEAIAIELQPFSRSETAAVLRHTFPDASEHDIDEFHRLSSHNPRVQALALSRALPLQQMLRLLGPNPTSVEDTIASLLDDAIAKLKDASGPIERERVEKICAGLAVLRPLIPIPILSTVSGVGSDAIKSFAYDIGRPLLVTGESIQFLDEPAETWFRDKFKPTAQRLADFITGLRPLASRSAYVASMLPPLMLEAGQFSELVEIALSSAALPETSPLERRDVELQRLQFALKATLRSGRHLDATKLVMKAGGETAGDERQRKLLQANTDLASDFLEVDLIQEIVSRRTFGSGWLGSHHAYEAALLSGRGELVADARSRLRMAHEWLQNWGRLPTDEREHESISDQDILELIQAHLNIYGPSDAVEYLGRWRPREVSYRVGSRLIHRLIDHGRWSDIDEIAHAADHNLRLTLAIIAELREVNKTPPHDVIHKAFQQLSKHRLQLRKRGQWDETEAALDAVTAVVEAALKTGLCTHTEAASVLARHLPSEPPRGLASRFSISRSPLLRAYCLHAALEGRSIELIDLAHGELKVEIEKANPHTTSSDLREFQEDVGALLPWHRLWASSFLATIKKEDIADEIEKAAKTSAEAERNRYREGPHVANEIALLRMSILHQHEVLDADALAAFDQWKSQLNQPLYTPTLNALCRLCAQRPETKATAIAFATESYALTLEDRSDAENKSDGYVGVARAILTTSKADAKAYFNAAVEVAGKIGDENLARWDAILDLADRAARTDRYDPKVAYQLARGAELTYVYVVRDKHFPWNSTVIALCGLCPPSAIAILSRWRDRKFGWHERLLPVAIGNLIERTVIDPRDALPLIGFRAQWAYDELLDASLTSADTAEEKALVSHMVHRYAQFSALDSADLTRLEQAAAKHDVAIAGLADAIASAERREAIHKARTSSPQPTPSAHNGTRETSWDDIFATKDVATAEGLSQAYLAFKGTEPPWSHETFFTQAMRRVAVGSEARFIDALANAPEFDLYSFRVWLAQMPESWKARPAISQALANTIRVLCRRHCMEVRKYRYYEVFPFEVACPLAGISEADVVDVVLTATGESLDFLEAKELFSLIGLLTTKLSPDEALDALKYALDLFNPVLEDKDGDGPWNEHLSSPEDIRGSIAGYVWSAAAAPEAVLRWESAHTILEYCRLGRREVMNQVVKRATAGSGGPFVDARLPFYELHALQWFLIGMARASQEVPGAVFPYAQQLLNWSLPSQSHVLIRLFAARAARALVASGLLADDDNLAMRLECINTSPLAIVESDTDEPHAPRKPRRGKDDEEDQFYFGIDIGPYWYAPLGRRFALSQGEIESEAMEVIRKDFGYKGTSRWDDDPRVRSKLYEERHTDHDHGSYPRADNLHFYYAYHAMMIVAGRLLATTPLHRHPRYDDNDTFADWLNGHDLTRSDGRWLWDHRDPEPLERGTWLQRAKEHPDYQRVTDADFQEALGSGDRLNLWGYWTEADDRREQSTSIHSALVAPDKSEALLRALASTKNVHDYAIPSADSDMEIDEAGFELKGWIADRDSERKLDRFDRWAGGITFPPPRPARFIVDGMRLHTDSDLRMWSDQSESWVMESQVWGHYDEARRYESGNPEKGGRLQVSASFVASMLTELDRDLIIEVQIERHRRHQPYESGERDDDERIETTAKLYLLGRDGKCRSL
jgi:hypothetical protein